MLSPKKNSSGFTLIELSIVLAVIGLLAAIALPTYADFTTRTKVSEGIHLSSAKKTAIWDTYSMRTGTLLTQADFAYQFPLNSSSHVTNITIASIQATPQVGDGAITIIHNVGVPALVTVITPGTGPFNGGLPTGPIAVGVPIDWGCKTSVQKYAPSNCK